MIENEFIVTAQFGRMPTFATWDRRLK